MSGRPLIIEKRKWDGSVSARWTARFQRDGARMTWRTPPGTPREHPRSGRHETTEHLEVSATCGEGWIVTAVIDADGELLRYEVDATAGQEVERDGVLAFIDLDLDLEINEGAAEVTDLMQFAERREQMGYPPGMLSAVVTALDKALRRHRRGDWPFDGSLR
ncbi:MAG TPA: DUF402 domain-containing protein [Miltoncostaeaceae bacterium]|nr:DUF402 domain-containing protein [Miltoncostaeaceae bacterium]